MKIFFAGTPEFAVPVLTAISQTNNICGVLTAPDKPQGRGKKVLFSPVKIKAIELGYNIIQPATLDDDAIEAIKKLSPDILVVAAYGKIFKEYFLSIFPKSGINLHPSLLPAYRGPAPIPAIILSGDSEAGVTVQKLALKMDTGDILAQTILPLSGIETTESLTETCSRIGAEMIVNVLEKIEANKIESTPQNESKATYCRLIKKENGLIDWNNSAPTIEKKIRAYFPWPKAYTYFNGQHLAITEGCIYSDLLKETNLTGYVLGVDKQCGILVKTGNGILGIKRLQLQTRNEVDFRSFCNGNNIIDRVLGD